MDAGQLHHVLEGELRGGLRRVGPLVAVLPDAHDQLRGRHAREHPLEVMVEPSLARDRTGIIGGIVLVVQHEEEVVVDGAVALDRPARVVARDRLGHEPAVLCQPCLERSQEAEQRGVARVGQVLEVDGDSSEIVPRHGVGDRGDGAMPQSRMREQAGDRHAVEIVAGEIRDQREHADRSLGERDQAQHAPVHLEAHGHAVHPAVHEAPLGHHPIERVDVAPE